LCKQMSICSAFLFSNRPEWSDKRLTPFLELASFEVYLCI
jgi:hypothetical protein